MYPKNNAVHVRSQAVSLPSSEPRSVGFAKGQVVAPRVMTTPRLGSELGSDGRRIQVAREAAERVRAYVDTQNERRELATRPAWTLHHDPPLTTCTSSESVEENPGGGEYVTLCSPFGCSHISSAFGDLSGCPHLVTRGQKTVTPQQKPKQYIHFDWLQFTINAPVDPQTNLDTAIHIATEALNVTEQDLVMVEGGFYGYRYQAVGPANLRILWGSLNEEKPRSDVHVQMTGKTCSAISNHKMLWLMEQIQQFGQPTRIDLTLDDYDYVVDVDTVWQTLKANKDVVTHVRDSRRMESLKSGVDAGYTVYMGAPSSRRRLRVYDKGLESNGEIPAIRWELQERKDAARSLLPELIRGDWGQVFASRLVSLTDFREREAHSEVEKRPRLPWFQRLVGLASKAAVYLPVPPRTASELEEWLEYSIAPSLATLVQVFHGDMEPLYRMIGRGMERMKPKHHAIVATANVFT